MQTFLTASAFVLAMTLTVNAAETPKASTILAGGPIVAANQNEVLCNFVNTGPNKVTISSQGIYQSGSTTAISSINLCTTGSAVEPNQMCSLEAMESGGVNGYSCIVTFAEPATNVRGALQLFDASDNVQTLLATVEMR